MSDDLIIRAEKLTKVYRLYDKPGDRLAALFRKEKPDQIFDPTKIHHALAGVDLEVKRGEKVAIIGRNGAGKSTLLKIITRAIEPTSGFLDVRGKIHALLSLGVGFHPDFSGRENAYSFLAQMVFSVKKADALVDDAVEFAELEEYIDQPFKTYSTGMQARLMFSVSTALEPDLLVIDEVLGVGDAYFQHKSFERIRELCAAKNTTLLLVSHDIYSATKICPRVVWIDRGRVKGDGEAEAMLKLYADSIRVQEDARQKYKLALAYRRQAGERAISMPAYIEIRARNNLPAPSPVYFSDMSVSFGSEDVRPLPIHDTEGKATPLGPDLAVQLMPHCPWGAPTTIDGRMTRPWNNFGAFDHKVGIVIFPLSTAAAERLREATLAFTARTNDVVDGDVVFITPEGEEFILHRLMTKPLEWETVSVALAGGSPGAVLKGEAGGSGRLGSGRVRLSNFHMLDGDGEKTFTVRHGKRVTIAFDYEIVDEALAERCQIIFNFKRGVEDVARVIARTLEFDAGRSRYGRVEAEFDRMPLGCSKYSVTAMVAKEGYFETLTGLYFSINPDVYDCHTVAFEFEVVDTETALSTGTGCVLECDWRSIDGEAVRPALAVKKTVQGGAV